jgi:hypothetical protein
MNPLILMALGAVLGFALIRFPVTGMLVSAVLLAHSWRKRHDMDGGTPSNDDDTPPGYVDVAVSIEALLQNNGVLALAVALMIFPLSVFWTMYGFDVFMDDLLTGRNLVLAIPAVVIGIVLHEGIHALGWIVFGRVPPRDISFGVDRKTLSPYAHAHSAMQAAGYRIGALLPGVLTGLLPTIIGVANTDAGLTLLGAFLLSAAVGDILVVWVIRRVPGDANVRDHPSKAGCLVDASAFSS